MFSNVSHQNSSAYLILQEFDHTNTLGVGGDFNITASTIRRYIVNLDVRRSGITRRDIKIFEETLFVRNFKRNKFYSKKISLNSALFELLSKNTEPMVTFYYGRLLGAISYITYSKIRFLSFYTT